MVRTSTRLRRTVRLAVMVAVAALLYDPCPALAQAYLGSNLQPFAVLAGSAVTCAGTGATITGDLGVSPGSSVTGPCTVSGTIHAANATSLAAQNDLTTAFTTLGPALPCGLDLTGTDLGGLTLLPGVYCFSTSAQLTGPLTLNALGNPSSTWVFRIGSTLTTASGSSVNFINGGNPCGAQWRVGSSATLGTTTNFAGNILAQASITLNTNANLTGRALARTGAVTLDGNNVSAFAGCGAGGGSGGAPPPFSAGGSIPTLPPLALWLLAAALAAAGLALLRRRSLTQA